MKEKDGEEIKRQAELIIIEASANKIAMDAKRRDFDAYSVTEPMPMDF